jgi:hypothetical protein
VGSSRADRCDGGIAIITKGSTMKSLLLCLVLLAALPFATAASDASYETVLTKRIDGEVTIDTQGNVIAHAFATDMEPKVREVLDRAVAKWKFHPYLDKGMAVNARAKMRITLVARESGGDYQVAVDNILFHDGARDSGRADSEPDPLTGIEMSVARKTGRIEYPRYTVNGMTVVAVRLSPEGTVESILATQTTFLNAKGSDVDFERARKAMEDNAIAGIRKWKFKVVIPAGVQPRPEDLTGTILVNYHLAGREKLLTAAGEWRQETRTRSRAIPWISDTRLAQSVRASDMDGAGTFMPNAAALQLREGGAGAL